MIPAWAVSAGLRVAGWAKTHWREIGLGVGLLFMVGFIRQCGQLEACRAEATKTAEAHAAQVQQLEGRLTATANARGRLVIQPGPSRPCPPTGECPPCPAIDLTWAATAGTGAQGSGSQAQTATAKVEEAKSFKQGLPVAVWVAGGHAWAADLGAGDPRLQLGVQLGPVQVLGGRSLGGNWQADVAWRVWEFR